VINKSKRIEEMVNRVTNELGMPKNDKQVSNFAKRIKVEMDLLESDFTVKYKPKVKTKYAFGVCSDHVRIE